MTKGLPKTTGRSRQPEYSLEPEFIIPTLQAEIDALFEWMTDPPPQYRDLRQVVSDTIALNRLAMIYRKLGWLVQSKQVPVESLSLTQLIVFTPLKTAYDASTSFEENRQIERAAQRTAERTLNLVQEHLHWLETERQVSFSTQRLQLEADIDIAKFL